jgi:hypothetical protein
MSKKFTIAIAVAAVVVMAGVALGTQGQLLQGRLSWKKSPLSSRPVSSSFPASSVKPLSTANVGNNDNITRAQIATLVVDTLEVPSTSFSFGCFADTTGLATEGPICYLASKGIIQGYANGKFGPTNAVTRAEAAKLFYSTFLASAPAVNPPQQYSDVVPNTWYYQYIQGDSFYKILDITGGVNTKFYPTTTLSVGRAKYWAKNVKANVPSTYWAN